jgi:hypothetical protein
MADNSGNSALSGGLLVILGIVVALGAVFLYMHYHGGAGKPDISINLPAAVGK